MVVTDRQRERMNDAALHDSKNGPLAGRRREHLMALTAVETLACSLAPFPSTYDVTRAQPPYFTEYSHTEALGAFMIAPQSTEAATRMVECALNDTREMRFDFAQTVSERLLEEGTLDKYTLENTAAVPNADTVLFLPGSNLFEHSVDKNTLARFMYENPEAIIKPHPLTNEHHLRMMGMMFGYHRIVDPLESGFAYLKRAKQVGYTTSTEMGLYAALAGKSLVSMSNFHSECRGAYYHLYRFIPTNDPARARDALTRVLGSPFSGVFHPNDPTIESGLREYFARSLEIRELLRPRAFEMQPEDYTRAVYNAGTRPAAPTAQPAPPKKG